MRPAEGLLVEWVDDEAVVLQPEGDSVHYLNRSAALVFALIQELGYEKAMDQLRESFGSGPLVEVEDVLQMMLEKGILLEER